jgi:hypothetical protein
MVKLLNTVSLAKKAHRTVGRLDAARVFSSIQNSMSAKEDAVKKEDAAKKKDSSETVVEDDGIVDWTNPKLFLWNLVALILLIVDQLLGCAWTAITLGVAGTVGALVAIFGPGIQDVLTLLGRGSAVSTLDPGYLDDYEIPKLIAKKLESTLKKSPEVDLQVAYLCTVLSGVAYEERPRHDALMKSWKLESQDLTEDRLTSPREGWYGRVTDCPSLTATVVSLGKAVMVVFKGTSPFNLNEWLTDFSVPKIYDHAELCELQCRIQKGGFHDGFYRAFFPAGFDIVGDKAPFMAVVREVVNVARAANIASDKLRLWVTGHSLGAALASVFVAIIASADIATPETNCSFPEAVTTKAELLASVRSCIAPSPALSRSARPKSWTPRAPGSSPASSRSGRFATCVCATQTTS